MKIATYVKSAGKTAVSANAVGIAAAVYLFGRLIAPRVERELSERFGVDIG